MPASDRALQPPPNEAVFKMEAEDTTFLWVRTCPKPKCDCRSALVVTTTTRADLARVQDAVAGEMDDGDGGSVADAARLHGAEHFRLDIDTGDVFRKEDGVEVDLTANPRIAAVTQRIDGELLDEIGRLWRRGKGCNWDPEQEMLSRQEVLIRGWRRGGLVAWDNLHLGVRQDLYPIGRSCYEAHELYCPVPDCHCDRVYIKFTTGVKKSTTVGHVCVSFSGEPQMQPEGRRAARLQQLWEAFQRRHPGHKARLARRLAVMKTLGARFVDPDARQAPPPAQDAQPELPVAQNPSRPSMKVGRNEPCPCGSGHKYKKCCGASL